MLFVFIHASKISVRSIFLYSLLVISFLYFTFFITYNRKNFIHGNINSLVFNPSYFQGRLFLEQTRGALADFTILKYYKDDPNAEFDYGYAGFNKDRIR